MVYLVTLILQHDIGGKFPICEMSLISQSLIKSVAADPLNITDTGAEISNN